MSDNLPPLEPDLEDHAYELWGQNVRGDFVTVEKAKAYASAAIEAKASEWQPISTAPKDGTLVVVYSPNGPDDWPDAIKVTFDYFCQDYENWFHHSESYEHFMAVGGSNACGPDVTCTGPSQEAPYTHWMPLPLPPKRCEYCDGTGDVTGLDGEWRGYCVCDAGQALKTPPPAERCKCGYPMPCGLTVPVQFCRA